MGQVNFLVFLGLASSMVLIKKEKWFWAGAVLILTSIKPHLVILAVIYLLIIMAQRRQFVGWAGLLCGSIACAIILFIFRPPWIYDFFGMLAIPPVNWATPTLGGLLNSQQISNYFILLLLPLPFLLANLQRSISMEFSIALLTVITVPFTFFGWSYDQTILLIPIAQLFIWIYHLNNKLLNFGFASICTISLLINYWQRILNINEVYYVWVPLVWCLVFGLTWRLYSEKQGVL